MLGDTLGMLKQKRKASLCANEMLTDSQAGQGKQVIRKDRKQSKKVVILQGGKGVKCKVIHNHEQQVLTEQLLCMKHWERYKGFGTSCPSIACVRSERVTQD